MLEIGKEWKEWSGYSKYGVAYFGINSIPIRVADNVYQVKCLCSKTCNSNEYEMKYLQFNLDTNNCDLCFLNRLQNNYIKSMKFSGHETDNSNVYIVGEFERPIDIRPRPYNAKQIHSLFIRLSKLKKQSKPILK